MKYYASLSVYRICGRQNDHEPQTDCQFRRVACIAFTLFLYLWKESGRFSLLRKGRKQCFHPCPDPSSRQIPVQQSPSGRCQNRNSRQQGGCQTEDFLQKPAGWASAFPIPQIYWFSFEILQHRKNFHSACNKWLRLKYMIVERHCFNRHILWI